ncbi:MAG TPA: sugar ABC transporter permease [Halanaerobiales bacterium]|nr:sugar ABC transporter permease [Halanaerobiales bacterium]
MGSFMSILKKGINKTGESLESYSFLAPAYLIFIIFIFIPVLRSFYLSFFDYSLLSFNNPEFAKFANYLELINDDVFWVALKNTVVYSLGTVPVKVAIGLFIALMLDSNKLIGKTFFKTTYFIPVVTSMVASSIIWTMVFNSSEFGLANRLISILGVTPKGWLADSNYAMFSVITMSIWKSVGQCMIIYIAGLQGIPLEVYEAADIDGATSWKKFLHVTLPLLKPTTFFLLTTQIIGAFQVFTQTYIMTGGGPGYSTITLLNLLYTKGFQEFDMGYTSTLAVGLFVTLLLMTIILRKLFQSDEVTY